MVKLSFAILGTALYLAALLGEVIILPGFVQLPDGGLPRPYLVFVGAALLALGAFGFGEEYFRAGNLLSALFLAIILTVGGMAVVDMLDAGANGEDPNRTIIRVPPEDPTEAPESEIAERPPIRVEDLLIDGGNDESTGTTVLVPDVRGLQEADAVSGLASLGLEVEVQRVCSPRFGVGRVLAAYAGEFQSATVGLPAGDSVIGQEISTALVSTVFVSDGDCSESHCSLIPRPSNAENVRFATGREDKEERFTLSPGEAAAFELNVRAGQTIEVTASSERAGAEHLFCVFDTDGEPIAAGSTLRVTSPPLRISGNHLVIVEELSGVSSDYHVRFFVPAQ